MTDARVSEALAEVLIDNHPPARVSEALTEVLIGNRPPGRVSEVLSEVLIGNRPPAQVSELLVEVLYSTTAFGTASVAGSGTLTAVRVLPVEFAGSGSLTTTGSPSITTTAAPAGAGGLDAAGTPAINSSAALSGAGSVSAIHKVNVALAGSGTLTASGSPINAISRTLTGSGTLVAVQTGVGAADLAGSGALTAMQLISTQTDMYADGLLDADGVRLADVSISVTRTGSGSLAASGAVAPRARKRWTLYDPDTLESFSFPMNPNKMTSPHAPRALTIHPTTPSQLAANSRGRVIEGNQEPYEWTFSGAIREEAQYDELLRWSRKVNRLQITDHLDRTFRIRITEFAADEQKPTARRDWRFNYDLKTINYGEIS